MCTDISSKTIELHEDEYGFLGTSAKVGTFNIVTIDVNHPNYGYYTEFMAFWRSPHCENWSPIQIHRGSCDIHSPEDLIERFPKFSALFAEQEV
jgi:hypothetical protein